MNSHRIRAYDQLQQDGTWQVCELSAMQGTFAAELIERARPAAGISAATEVGDPQFYLLGSPPDEDCILAISRLGRLYILEDGAGQVVYEHTNLERLTDKAKAFLRTSKASMVARMTLLWAAVRHTFEEKLEPILAESEEMLLHVAPQLAAFV